VQDFVFTLAQLPAGGGKFRSSEFASVGGGPAATAAAAIARLGGESLLVARVGADEVGSLIAAELEAYGVDCRHLRRFAGRRSSLSAVMLDAAGERMIVNHLDAAMPSDATWIPDPRAERVGAVLADTRWPEGARQALRLAREAGLPGVLDADRPVPADAALLGAASHVAFSEPGLEDLAGPGEAAESLARVSRDLPGWCCVTVGARGTLVARHGRIEHEPAFQVDVVDTLGAGDVWHGAFALALAEGLDEAVACRFAAAAAAVKVQRHGGRAGAPSREDTLALLAGGRRSTQHKEALP
jgi:sulfofructose kinase